MKNPTSDKIPTAAEKNYHPSHGEYYKAQFDYLKHITTLSTGSILLIATMLDKLFKQPKGPLFIEISVLGFIVSVIGSMASYSISVLHYPRPGRYAGNTALSIMAAGILVTWLAFLAGICGLGVFFLINWGN